MLYLKTIYPLLIKGIDFLYNYSKEVSYYLCRFIEIVNRETARLEGINYTFKLAYFNKLALLERWY
jgi:heme-containing dehydratase-like protein